MKYSIESSYRNSSVLRDYILSLLNSSRWYFVEGLTGIVVYIDNSPVIISEYSWMDPQYTRIQQLFLLVLVIYKCNLESDPEIMAAVSQAIEAELKRNPTDDTIILDKWEPSSLAYTTKLENVAIKKDKDIGWYDLHGKMIPHLDDTWISFE